MKQILALAAFLVCLSSGAWCQGPDALPDGANYPDPPCQKPQVSRIDKPQSSFGAGGFDSGAVGSYNSKVKAFNKEAQAYDACMHAYIDKANGDVKRVQDKANADLKQITDRANASMHAIQDKIRQAVAEANGVSASLKVETSKIKR
jgi:hypothetical protein